MKALLTVADQFNDELVGSGQFSLDECDRVCDNIKRAFREKIIANVPTNSAIFTQLVNDSLGDCKRDHRLISQIQKIGEERGSALSKDEKRAIVNNGKVPSSKEELQTADKKLAELYPSVTKSKCVKEFNPNDKEKGRRLNYVRQALEDTNLSMTRGQAQKMADMIRARKGNWKDLPLVKELYLATR